MRKPSEKVLPLTFGRASARASGGRSLRWGHRMNIGEAAQLSGLPTKTIRYYESIGLVSPKRRPNGFRDYGKEEVRKLRFIGCARSLGFTVEECRALIDLFEESSPQTQQWADLVSSQMNAIQRKIGMLRALASALAARSAGDRQSGALPLLEEAGA